MKKQPRYDYYFNAYRMRRLKERNKPWRYEKINSSQSGLAVNKDNVELYIEKVTTSEKKSYFITEYDPSQDSDFKKFVHNLRRYSMIKDIKNLGDINMKSLYLKMKSHINN